MIRFLITRVLQGLGTLLIVGTITFLLARVTGNPADTLLPIEASPQDREALVEQLGLDKPIASQYWTFVSHAATGDFGVSVRNRRPVAQLVVDRLWSSILLATVVLLETIAIGLPFGAVAAIYRGRLLDKVALGVSVLGQSLPAFWTGLLAIQLFAVLLHWLPSSGLDGPQYIVLPSLVLALAVSAGMVRLVRSSMLEVLGADFVRTARSKGLAERLVITRHALPNALIPAITFLGITYGQIVGAAIAVEIVFSWPGLGRLTYDALLARDFPVLQACVLAWASIVVAVNFFVDLLYVIADPRIKL
jgi:peptide/nickel transport system permease protein